MLKLFHPDGNLQERKYIHDILIKDFLGLDYVTEISDDKQYSIKHESDGFTQTINLPDIYFSHKDGKIPELPLDGWHLPKGLIENSKLSDIKQLPILFGNSLMACDICSGMKNISLPIDIFGSSFFMLSRYEELTKTILDKHQRFPATDSVA